MIKQKEALDHITHIAEKAIIYVDSMAIVVQDAYMSSYCPISLAEITCLALRWIMHVTQASKCAVTHSLKPIAFVIALTEYSIFLFPGRATLKIQSYTSWLARPDGPMTDHMRASPAYPLLTASQAASIGSIFLSSIMWRFKLKSTIICAAQ
jgi:hypothetical protein